MADGRNRALDGVRGLAALSVALVHCLFLIAGMDVWYATIRDFPTMTFEQTVGRLLLLAFPGNAAVMVFFVLSGHVLWASFARKDMTLSDFPDYLSARVFRLMPLVIVSTILFSIVIMPSVPRFIANMLLLSNSMNSVTWSLQTEMVGSLLIFVVWIWSRNEPLKIILALFVVGAAVPFFRGNHLVVFLPAFLLGALTHHVPAWIWRSRALLLAALVVLLIPSLFFTYQGVTRIFEILAASVIVGCVSVQRPRFLESRLVSFLGAISYPFYLFHPIGLTPALEVVGMIPHAHFLVKMLVYTVVSLGISMPLAWLLHVTIEMPALKIRPRLARKPASVPPAA